MAWYDNLKSALHPYDDEYIENEAAAAEEEFEDYPPKREARVFESRAYEEPPPRYEEPKTRRKAQPAPIQPQQPPARKTEYPYVAPKTFEEASGIADDLRNRKTIIMNLEACNPETARRLLDFLSGVAYAIGGKVNRISARTYMVTPNNVDLVGAAVEDLESNGIYF